MCVLSPVGSLPQPPASPRVASETGCLYNHSVNYRPGTGGFFGPPFEATPRLNGRNGPAGLGHHCHTPGETAGCSFSPGRIGAEGVQLSAEDDCQTEADAQRLGASLQILAGELKSRIATPQEGSTPSRPAPFSVTADPAMNKILESLALSVEGNRLLLKLTVDGSTLNHLFAEKPTSQQLPASPAPPRSQTGTLRD